MSCGRIANGTAEKVIFIFTEPLVDLDKGVSFLIEQKRVFVIQIAIVKNARAMLSGMNSEDGEIAHIDATEENSIHLKNLKELEDQAIKKEKNKSSFNFKRVHTFWYWSILISLKKSDTST